MSLGKCIQNIKFKENLRFIGCSFLVTLFIVLKLFPIVYQVLTMAIYGNLAEQLF